MQPKKKNRPLKFFLYGCVSTAANPPKAPTLLFQSQANDLCRWKEYEFRR